MKFYFTIFVCLNFFVFVTSFNAWELLQKVSRAKREVSGALDIITNNAQPIHADVKSDGNGQVTPPSDTLGLKSLRKSSPLLNKLDLIRGVNRVVTLLVLLVSVVIEFYPMLSDVYYKIESFVNYT